MKTRRVWTRRACASLVLVLLLVACEDAAWREAEADGSRDAYESFLRRFPGGDHALQAETRLAELDLERARSLDTIPAYEAFLERWPSGAPAARAAERLARLQLDDALRVGTGEALGSYLERHPDSPHREEARLALLDLRDREAWAEAKRQPTEASFEAYSRDHPEGRFAVAARAAIDELRQRFNPAVYLVQQRLAEKGGDPGPADGRSGERTRLATRAYQERVGLDATGELSSDLLQHLSFSKEEIASASSGPIVGNEADCKNELVFFSMSFFHALLGVSKNAERGFVCCDGGPLDWWATGIGDVSACLSSGAQK